MLTLLCNGVDGHKSIYANSSRLFETYHEALENYINPSISDKNVVNAIENLKASSFPTSFVSLRGGPQTWPGYRHRRRFYGYRALDGEGNTI